MNKTSSDIDRTTEAEELFENTLENSNLMDIFSQAGEVAVDYFIDTPIIRDIPILGLLTSGYKSVIDIKNKFLAKKIYKFLYHLRGTTVEQRQAFIKKYCEANQQNTAISLLGIIEQLNNGNFIPILCNLIKAVIVEEIDICQFNRIVMAMQRTAYTDLTQLEKFIQDYYEEGLSEALVASGLVYQSVFDGGDADLEDDNCKFRLSHTGRLLLQYGFLKNAQLVTPRSTIVKGNLYWEEL